MGEIYGGFLGSHCVKNDVFFAYGNTYGTRIKVVVITKNFQTTSKEDIRKITSQVHSLYIEDKLNPFAKNEQYSDDFVAKIEHLCINQ